MKRVTTRTCNLELLSNYGEHKFTHQFKKGSNCFPYCYVNGGEFKGEEKMQSKISNAYKQAMLNKDEDSKRVIGTLRAEIKNKEIELRPSGKEITDADIMSLIQKLIKQNKDAIEMFKTGGREDLVEKNEKEIEILSQFLPKQLTTDEIDSILKTEIETNSITSMKEMGKLMGVLKSKYSGQMDFGYVSKRVKDLI